MLLYVGRLQPQRNWAMSRHVHPNHDELIVVLAGELHTQIAGTRLVGTRGTVLRYPAGYPHAECAVGPRPLETIFIGYRHPRSLHLPLHARDRAGHVLHAARWMLSLHATRSPRRRAASAVLHAILQELAATAAPDDDLFRRISGYIEYHLAEPLTLQTLADEAGLSRYHFARAFTRLTGQSPMAYVRQARIHAACALVTSTQLPLRVIAPMVGLSNAAHLSRVCRAVTGKPPMAWRATTPP